MTRSGRRIEVWLAVLAALALLGGVLYPLQARIDTDTHSLPQEKEELLLHSDRLLRHLSLGYEGLLADIYWTRVVQYYGRKRAAHDPRVELLAPLLDLTTALDPNLVVAYRFGAIFLAELPPRGAGRPDLAADLIRRGIAANPDEWRLWADLGFLYYWDMKDYPKAAEAYLEGSRQPGAREWMKAMAARIAERGGSRETSRFLWAQLYESTTDLNLRRTALEHLQALKAEEDIEHLEEIIGEFERRFRRAPASFADLIGAGMLGGIPADPAGYAYVLGAGGTVRLNPASPIATEAAKPAAR